MMLGATALTLMPNSRSSIDIDSVNRAPEFMAGKKLVAERCKPDPAVLADESVPLKSLLEAAG